MGLRFVNKRIKVTEIIKFPAGNSISGWEMIGTVGQTGRATCPHLHWGMKLYGARVNPMLLSLASGAAESGRV